MADNLLKAVWSGYRPYLIVFVVDLLVAGSLWGVLAIFKWLTKVVPLRERASDVISTIHAAGVIIVFGVLAVSLVYDVIQMKRGKRGS